MYIGLCMNFKFQSGTWFSMGGAKKPPSHNWTSKIPRDRVNWLLANLYAVGPAGYQIPGSADGRQLDL